MVGPDEAADEHDEGGGDVVRARQRRRHQQRVHEAVDVVAGVGHAGAREGRKGTVGAFEGLKRAVL